MDSNNTLDGPPAHETDPETTYDPEKYVDFWHPIESNPDVFNPLAHSLGLSPFLAFHDVWDLEGTFLAGLPRPVHALIVVFPGGKDYEKKKGGRAAECSPPDFGKIKWFAQTIHNACGFYGLLHAVCNGEAGKQILPNSLLSTVLKDYPKAPASERGKVLRNPEIKNLYDAAALNGDSDAPALGVDVDCHYTCFVKSGGHLYELDGDLHGPVDLGQLSDQDDLVSDAALVPVRRFIESRSRDSIACNIMALTAETLF